MGQRFPLEASLLTRRFSSLYATMDLGLPVSIISAFLDYLSGWRQIRKELALGLLSFLEWRNYTAVGPGLNPHWATARLFSWLFPALYPEFGGGEAWRNNKKSAKNEFNSSLSRTMMTMPALSFGH